MIKHIFLLVFVLLTNTLALAKTWQWFYKKSVPSHVSFSHYEESSEVAVDTSEAEIVSLDRFSEASETESVSPVEQKIALINGVLINIGRHKIRLSNPKTGEEKSININGGEIQFFPNKAAANGVIVLQDCNTFDCIEFGNIRNILIVPDQDSYKVYDLGETLLSFRIAFDDVTNEITEGSAEIMTGKDALQFWKMTKCIFVPNIGLIDVRTKRKYYDLIGLAQDRVLTHKLLANEEIKTALLKTMNVGDFRIFKQSFWVADSAFLLKRYLMVIGKRRHSYINNSVLVIDTFTGNMWWTIHKKDSDKDEYYPNLDEKVSSNTNPSFNAGSYSQKQFKIEKESCVFGGTANLPQDVWYDLRYLTNTVVKNSYWRNRIFDLINEQKRIGISNCHIHPNSY